MTNSIRRLIIFAVLGISCGAIIEVRAGTITGGVPFPDMQCGEASVPIGSPLSPVKSFSKICSLDIVFTVMNSGGLESVRFNEIVTNNGPSWSDFHMQLGFGSGIGFSPISRDCGVVSFTDVPLPTSSAFQPLGVDTKGGAIDFGGGSVPSGSVSFGFSMNVQDFSQAFSQCIPGGNRLPGAVGYRFTLRETPTTTSPEPVTMVLLGTGLAGVAIKTRKRLKHRKGQQGTQ